jgi:hypothetical protein
VNALAPHQELHPDGTPQGRDPRKMGPADMEALGLERISRGDAVRAKCLDCMGSSPAEVRRCGDVTCALWPFRMGSDPFREKREISDEQREAAAERFRLAREART